MGNEYFKVMISVLGSIKIIILLVIHSQQRDWVGAVVKALNY